MRTVIVTGATSGFGHLITKEFLENGDRVIATGRNLTNRPEVLAHERTQHGSRLIEKSLDVIDPKQRADFVNFCASLGQIDILINNAGFGLFGALENASEEQIRYQMEVNFFGTTFLTRDLLPLIRKARGKIFNFSSVFGFMGFPLTSVYCASKFAVEGLTESLSYELYPHGVQVCLIEPGGYRTKFGNNTVWGELSTTYEIQTANYKKLHEKYRTGSSYQDPMEVARGVLKLSQKKRMPLRAAFGRDAGFTKYFRKWTPESIFNYITHRALGKLFTRAL